MTRRAWSAESPSRVCKYVVLVIKLLSLLCELALGGLLSSSLRQEESEVSQGMCVLYGARMETQREYDNDC